MINTFTYKGTTVTVEDGITEQGTLADERAYIQFKHPDKPVDSTVHIKIDLINFLPDYINRTIETHFRRYNIDLSDGEIQTATRFHNTEDSSYFVQFFNSATGPFSIGRIATRASLNNCLERNLLDVFGEPVFCFNPVTGYTFFHPLELSATVTPPTTTPVHQTDELDNLLYYTSEEMFDTTTDVTDWPVIVDVPNPDMQIEVTVVNAVDGFTYEYKLGEGSYQAGNLFTGLEQGSYTITVRCVNEDITKEIVV